MKRDLDERRKKSRHVHDRGATRGRREGTAGGNVALCRSFGERIWCENEYRFINAHTRTWKWYSLEEGWSFSGDEKPAIWKDYERERERERERDVELIWKSVLIDRSTLPKVWLAVSLPEWVHVKCVHIDDHDDDEEEEERSICEWNLNWIELGANITQNLQLLFSPIESDWISVLFFGTN